MKRLTCMSSQEAETLLENNLIDFEGLEEAEQVRQEAVSESRCLGERQRPRRAKVEAGTGRSTLDPGEIQLEIGRNQ